LRKQVVSLFDFKVLITSQSSSGRSHWFFAERAQSSSIRKQYGVIWHVGIAATFGLIVMCMIYTFGEISGAQFNTAVTIGFAIAGKFDKKV